MDGWMDVNKHKRRKKNGRIYIDGRHRETGTTPFSVQLFRYIHRRGEEKWTCMYRWATHTQRGGTTPFAIQLFRYIFFLPFSVYISGHI